ncbi:hypothetical protein Holit_03346 [Hollandina sp. SP2]
MGQSIWIWPYPFTKAEEQEIPKGIIDEYPDQMKRDFALWTGEEVETPMNILSKTPKGIKRYFLDPAIAYAADV